MKKEFAEDVLIMRQLLVISCSKNKIPVEQIEAIELYDGPYYKIVRKLIREGHFPESIDILIISAKYGLVEANRVLKNYDQKMTTARAAELNEEVINLLQKKLESATYNTIYLNLGKTYLASVQGLENIVPERTSLIVSQGEIGIRMRDMKEWILSISRK